MEDAILWGDDEYTVGHILQNMRSRLPLIVRTAEGHYGETTQSSVSCGETYRFHTWGSHSRAICMSHDGKMYSIPLEYPIKFAALRPKQTLNCPPKSDKHYMTLSDLYLQNELPFDVVMEAIADQFKVDKDVRPAIDLGQLTVRDIVQEKFVKANPISRGFMSKSIVVFTNNLNSTFHIGKSFDATKNPPFSWKDMNKALDSIASTIDYSQAKPNLDILQYTEIVVSSITSERRHPATKHIISEMSKSYDGLATRTYATLVRTQRQSEQSSIENTVRVVQSDTSSSATHTVVDAGAEDTRDDYLTVSPEPASKSKDGEYQDIDEWTMDGDIIDTIRKTKQPEDVYITTQSVNVEEFQKRDKLPPGHALRPEQSRYVETKSASLKTIVPITRGKHSMQSGEWKSYTHAGFEGSTKPPKIAPKPLFHKTKATMPEPVSGRYSSGPSNRTSDSLPRLPPPPPVPGSSTSGSVTLPMEGLQSSSDLSESVNWRDTDLPETVESLTCEQLAQCLRIMNLGQYADRFKQEQVNGDLLLEFDIKTLTECFEMNAFHATKLIKFAKEGWRPK